MRVYRLGKELLKSSFSDAEGLRAPPVVPQCAQGSPMRTQYALRNSKMNQYYRVS